MFAPIECFGPCHPKCDAPMVGAGSDLESEPVVEEDVTNQGAMADEELGAWTPRPSEDQCEDASEDECVLWDNGE